MIAGMGQTASIPVDIKADILRAIETLQQRRKCLLYM